MPSITAILTAYRRPHTLARLVAAIRSQTVPVDRVWAWANEPDGEVSATLRAAGLQRTVSSSENTYFHGRFALALLAPSEYVAIFDDDSIPGARWLENCLQTMVESPGILGTAGIVLNGPGYGDRTMLGWQRPSDKAVEVDLVGQAWFLKTAWVRYLFAEPAVTGTNGEDIELAARAWRLGEIRSFCPPHPASDRSRWGSTQGLELGTDQAAASLRASHLAEREQIVRAELSAGWQPLFMRRSTAPAAAGRLEATAAEDTDAIHSETSAGKLPSVTHGDEVAADDPLIAAVPASAQRILLLGPNAGRCAGGLKSVGRYVAGVKTNGSAGYMSNADFDEVWDKVDDAVDLAGRPAFDCVLCDGLLDHARRPADLLRRLRACLKPDGLLLARIGNARCHNRIASLLRGEWPCNGGTPAPTRYWTRREIEKLLYRTGFEIRRLASRANAAIAAWHERGRPPRVDSGSLRIATSSAAEAQEFLTEEYVVTARRASPESGPSAASGTRAPTESGRCSASSLCLPASRVSLTSIVIVTHNQLGYTRACLESIRFYTDEPYEIVVVDNGSTDGTVEYLRSLREMTIVENSENRGFPAAANQGIRAARGRQVLLLNNDVLVTTGWLGRLLDALASDRQVGLVGPVSNHVSGEQQIDVNYDDLAGLDGFAWDWAREHARDYRDVERLVGFCLLIRRDVIDSVGLLDERFGIGNYEDDDYCRRALAAGYRAVIARDAFIHHFGHRSFAAAGIDLNALLEQNRNVYEAKWAIEKSPRPTVQPRSGVAPATSDAHAQGPATNDQGPRQLTLSLCMIVRDNVGTIRAALESIKPWVDEMIVVDTGSTDATPEICRELGAHVHRFPWPDSFSLARNESLRHARGRWIFWMDSDDVIDEANGRKLRELSRREPPAGVLGYIMQVHCPGAGDDGRHDVTVVDHCKMFLNRPDLRFEGRIHEQVLESIRRSGGDVAFTDIFVVHAGADHTPEGRRRKLRRDIRLLHLDRRERPNHPFVHFNLGMTYADAGKHRKAIRSLRRSLELSQPHESHVRKVYALLAASYRELGLAAEACQAVSEGMKLYPKDPELLFRKAMLAHESGRLAEAERCYLAALANDDAPHFASFDRGIIGFKARHNLAAVYTDMGALHKAEAEWRQIVAEVPDYAEGWHGLVETLLAQGRTAEAHRAATELAGEKRTRCTGLMLLAATAQARGDLQAARCGLLRAVQEFPEAVEPLRRLCRMVFDHGHPSEAQVVLGKLTELDPSDAAAYHNLGTAALRNGNASGAVEAFQASLRLRPGFALTQLSLGYALREAGRTAEAIEAFEDCLRLAPDGPLAAEAQRQLDAVKFHVSGSRFQVDEAAEPGTGAAELEPLTTGD